MYVCEDYVSTEFWALIVKAPFNILKFWLTMWTTTILVSRKSMASIVMSVSIVHEDIGASEKSNGLRLLRYSRHDSRKWLGETPERRGMWVWGVSRAGGNIQSCQQRGGRLPESEAQVKFSPGQAQASHKTCGVSRKYGTRLGWGDADYQLHLMTIGVWLLKRVMCS